MDVLEVKNLTKNFGPFTAVNDISFSLKEGEILGLLGQNGAGKTTTIQMLLGVLKPTGGEIRYSGKDFQSNREDILEKINFSSTYTNLMWWLTVRENLTYLSYLYDIKDRKKRVEKVCEIFYLTELMDNELTELSAGQLTRLNLAKAYLNFPTVLLLDEPTASLDPEIAYEVRQFLKKERKEFDVSIIVTSHNMIEVEELCDRVMIIEKGEIIANDTPVGLTQRITTSDIELFIRKGMPKAKEYLKNNTISFMEEGNRIKFTVPSEKIAHHLQNFNKEEVEYADINIQKPSLEDYFLQLFERKEK